MTSYTVFLRAPHNYDVDSVSHETSLVCKDESLTIQSQAEDADINTIVQRFGLTGQLPVDVRVPMVGDFTGATTYQDMLHQVRDAEAAFMQFPAEVRARFNHDPQKLIDFCSDSANYEEAVKLGIANARAPAPSPAAADPVAPTA